MSTTKNIEQIHALNLAFAATEQQLKEEITAKTQREQDVAAQLLAVQQQAEQQRAELARSHSEQERTLRHQYAERETALQQQLQAGHQELQRLQLELAQREKIHAEQASQTRQELETLLRHQAQREQEVAAQLLAAQQQAEQQRAELASSHSEQERTLRHQYAERETALQQQLQIEQHSLLLLRHEFEKLEKEYAEQTSQNLRKLEDEAQIKASMLNDLHKIQNQSEQFEQALNQLRKQLAATHATFSWRVTAPFRAVSLLFVNRSKPVRLQNEEIIKTSRYSKEGIDYSMVSETGNFLRKMTEQNLEEAMLGNTPRTQKDLDSGENNSKYKPSFDIKNEINSPSTFMKKIQFQPKFEIRPDRIYSLDAFLCLYDHSFVRAAYFAILDREPDSEGEEYYLNRLRQGVSKVRLLHQIVSSNEAKKIGVKVTGLDMAMVLERIYSIPIIGAGLRAVVFLSSLDDYLKDLRALENHIFRVAEESQSVYLSELECVRSALDDKK